MTRVIGADFVSLGGVMEARAGERHPDGKNEWSTPALTSLRAKARTMTTTREL